MNQKLEDLKLLLKNDKRVMAAAIFVVVALFIWMVTGSGSGGRPRVHMPPDPGSASKQGQGGEEAFNDLVVAFKSDIDAGKKDRQDMTEILMRTKKDLSDYKEKSTGIFETLVDKFEQLSREVDQLAATVRNNDEVAPLSTTPAPEGPEELVKMWPDEVTPVQQPPEPQPLKVSVIAPGDSVSAQLLTGVNAPVDGTPYPVVFKLTGPITGPDGASLDLGESRIIAASQGSESDSRALFRITQLSIRHPSGRRSVVEVDGWVVGEDGIRGMSGKLIDKLGRLIATTAMVSGMAALGESLMDNTDNNNNSYSVSGNRVQGFTVSEDDMNYAAASALTDASNRLGGVLLNRYESLVPVVEVLSGRDVVIIFSKPAEIEVLDEGPVLASGSDFGLE